MAWFSSNSLTIPALLSLNAGNLRRKPAVIVDDCEVSWEAFGTGCAQLGNALLDAGLRKGDRVVVLMRNSYEMLEAMFGAVRAGLVVVPLNVSIADAAVAGMIRNSNAKAAIASDEHVQRIQGLAGELGKDFPETRIALEAAPEGWLDYGQCCSAAATEPPSVAVAPDDECNIIFSSGTTGLPKGIVHDHGGRLAWGSDMAVALRYHSGARTLCNLGLFSNISWVGMLATLFSGGTLVISRGFSVEDCLSTIERHRVTHTGMVPLQYQKLFEFERFSDYDLSSLQSSMCCGSALPLPLKEALAQDWPGAFIELYGLTEGLVTILSPEDMPAKLQSVGLPCPGQRLAIVDDDDKAVADGIAGEIVGECRFLMAGYHDNDAASRDSTWERADGSRWLRTGDIGKLDDDGFLYLVDRKKDMIISGGQNIYPADIEAEIVSHEAVSEVAVIGVASDKWGETPLAVVVLRAAADPDDITAWTNARLGRQQRIVATVVVDELPRNPNGKVLKRELRTRFAEQKF